MAEVAWKLDRLGVNSSPVDKSTIPKPREFGHSTLRISESMEQQESPDLVVLNISTLHGETSGTCWVELPFDKHNIVPLRFSGVTTFSGTLSNGTGIR